MNTFNSAINSFDSSVNSIMSHVDKNEYISTALALFLIVYAGVVAPQLPRSMINFFSYPLVQLFIFFLIAYIARKNATVAIIAAIAFMVTLITINKMSVNDKIMAMWRRENMQSVQPMPMPMQAPMLPPTVNLEEASIKSTVNIPEEALSEMRTQVPAELAQNIPGETRASMGAPLESCNSPQGYDSYPFMNTGCVRKANFRDSFYPQYVNMKPDAYLARYTGNDADGYDLAARYGGSGGGRRTYDSDRGFYNGVRGAYD